MKKTVRLVITTILFIPLAAAAQQGDTPVNKSTIINSETDSAGKKINNTDPASYDATTKITFKGYFGLLGSTLKQEFTKPFHMMGKDWRNAGIFAVTCAALGFADEPLQKYSVRLVHNNPAVKNISKYVTKFGSPYERTTIATLAAYGLIFKKLKLVNTTLLASQAYIAGSAIEIALKLLSGRTRPNYYTENVEAEPTFFGPFFKFGRDATGKKRYSSFPSGHAIIAFGAATVFSQEYRDKKYVPVIAYTAATLVGLSRMTENRHWATDILTGAVIGYLNGKTIVNNYHRYAKRKAEQEHRNTISFNLQYVHKQAIPGIIYTLK